MDEERRRTEEALRGEIARDRSLTCIWIRLLPGREDPAAIVEDAWGQYVWPHTTAAGAKSPPAEAVQQLSLFGGSP